MSTPKKPTGTPGIRGPAHQQLIDRERVLAEAHAAEGLDNQLDAINRDRRARWTALLAGREESAELRKWAADMQTLYGRATVRVWRNHLPWITALYVVRYGEVEDFWPAQLGADDLVKAQRWFRGETPRGVSYVREEA